MRRKKIVPDTPWHIGYAKMKKNDTRRDKRKCIYYADETCNSTSFGCYGLRCSGSSHCMYYCEDEREIWKERTVLLSKKFPKLFWNYSLYATCECPICGHQIELIKNKNQYVRDTRYCPYCNALYVSRKFWKKNKDTICFPMNLNVIDKHIILSNWKKSH